MRYQREERKSGGILGLIMASGFVGLIGGAIGIFFGVYAMSRSFVRTTESASSPEGQAQIMVVLILGGIGFLIGAISTAVLWIKARGDD